MGWPLVALGEVIRRRKEFIAIQPDETYSRCRVQTSARGIVLRDRVPGDAIKTKKQQVCRSGEFLVAEIDAKLGGYGIVPDALDSAIVSSHYFLFEVDERYLLRRFLHWYCQTANFLEQVNARGTTNYAAIRPSNVLTYTIPLPPLVEQQRIITKLDSMAALVAEGKKVSEAAKRDARAMLSNSFRQIIDGAPCRPMAEVAALVRRPVEIEPDRSYPELGIRSFGRGTFHKPALEGMSVGSKKLFIIRVGDLLFNIVFAWEGAVAIAQPKDDGRVGSHRFLTCIPDSNTATADFLSFYFLSPEGLSKLGGASPGGAGRNRTLGLRKLDAITVPTPLLDRQRWFDRLQGKVRQVEMLRERTVQDAETLLPAVLDRVFSA